MKEIKKVGVLGCGLMGSGIAQVCAEAGYETIVREVEQRFIDNGFKKIEGLWKKNVEKGKATAESVAAARAKLIGTTDLNQLKDCDLVIDALPEEIAIKKEMFKALAAVVPPTTIIASNTSSLSVTEMATFPSHPERFIGMHFFNPVPVMKLVEVVKTIVTAPENLDTAFNFVKSLGKVGIAAKDNCGFIVNLLLVPYIFDAIRIFEKGQAAIEDIDQAMRFGAGYPMGPFALTDLVGLDTAYKIGCVMYEENKEARYAPPSLLKKMVLMGYYGMKSGKGFYDYSQTPPKPTEFNF